MTARRRKGKGTRRSRKNEADHAAAGSGQPPTGRWPLASMKDYPGGWVLMLLIGTALALVAAGAGWIVSLVILAMILAVPLGQAADAAKRRFRVPRGATVTLVPVGLIVVILAALALGGIQIGAKVVEKLDDENGVAAQGPAESASQPTTQPGTARQAADTITRILYQDWMGEHGLGVTREVMTDTIEGWVRTAPKLVGDLFGQFLVGLNGVMTGLGVLLVSSLIAAQPRAYYRIFISLFPPTLRPRIEPVAQEVGRRLGRWAVARVISATALSVMTGIGLWISGVPWSAGLGLITGLTSFIPVIGTFIGGGIALLTAFVTEGNLIGVLIVFVAANVVETYLLLPVLLRRAANILPGLTIGALLIMGSIGGLAGMLIASPLCLIITTVAETSHDERVPLEQEAQAVQEAAKSVREEDKTEG